MRPAPPGRSPPSAPGHSHQHQIVAVNQFIRARIAEPALDLAAGTAEDRLRFRRCISGDTAGDFLSVRSLDAQANAALECPLDRLHPRRKEALAASECAHGTGI